MQLESLAYLGASASVWVGAVGLWWWWIAPSDAPPPREAPHPLESWVWHAVAVKVAAGGVMLAACAALAA